MKNWQDSRKQSKYSLLAEQSLRRPSILYHLSLLLATSMHSTPLTITTRNMYYIAGVLIVAVVLASILGFAERMKSHKTFDYESLDTNREKEDDA